jgi:hypothetical protein
MSFYVRSTLLLCVLMSFVLCVAVAEDIYIAVFALLLYVTVTLKINTRN